MSTIVGVRIAGAPVGFDHVSSSITLRHGRNSLDDGPLSSSAALELLKVDRAATQAFRVGDALELDHGDGPAFRGRLTDAKLEGDALMVVAIGPLGYLSRRPVGLAGYPGQLWSDRVRAVAADAGVLELLELELGDFDPALIPAEPDRRSLGSALAELAADVGAAIADTPAGTILVQTLEARRARAHVAIPPGQVVYVPGWGMIDDVENRIEVAYAGDQALVVEDVASRNRFEERPGSLSTRIAGFDDAKRRALERLNRLAFPDWAVTEATVLGRIPLSIGDPVELAPLPLAAPTELYTGVLEGWTDELEADEWTMTLAMTAPRLSGIGLRWIDVDRPAPPMIVNGDFRDGLTGWNTKPDSTMTLEAGACRCTRDVVSWNGGTWQDVELVAGESYRMTWRYKLAPGRGAFGEVGGNEVGDWLDVPMVGTGEWVETSATYLAPPGALTGWFGFFFYGAGAAADPGEAEVGDWFLVDDVVIASAGSWAEADPATWAEPDSLPHSTEELAHA